MSFSNFREISELKPVKLNDVIEKNPKSDYGFFNDIANDLSKFSDDEDVLKGYIKQYKDKRIDTVNSIYF